MNASSAQLNLPTLDEVRAEKARRSLREFIKQAWHIVEPATTYLHNWHIDVMSEYLQAVSNGEINQLLINIPPRHMKSICATVMFPCWEWIEKPYLRYLCGAYSSLLSTKHSLDRRDIIQSSWYQKHFGDSFQLTTDQNVKTEYKNNHQGVMVSTGFGGSATGKGGDRVIVDDPHNPLEVLSDACRESDLRFFDLVLSSRLNDKKKGAFIVVMQRLHEKDISARCLELGYTHLNLPAEAEGKTTIVLPSGRTVEREDKELIWAEREGEKEIAQAKKRLGSYGYAAQYQQRPSPAGGGIFKRHWWRYWQPYGANLPPVTVQLEDGTYNNIEAVEIQLEFQEEIQSWDMSFKDLKSSDYVVGGCIGRNGANKYLKDLMRDKMSFTATLSAVSAMSISHPKTNAKYVEDKANGPAVISALKDKIPGLIAVEPEGGKIARAYAAQPQVEAGNVFLPHPQLYPWVNDFIEECAIFPNGANDDQVDMLTQGLLKLNNTIEWQVY